MLARELMEPDCELLVGVSRMGWWWIALVQKYRIRVHRLYVSAPTHARGQNICANFVPLAYKNRPYLGICGNSEELSSYWYYYPCLLQSVPVYPLWKTSNLNVRSSSLSALTSNSNRLNKFLILKSDNFATFVPFKCQNVLEWVLVRSLMKCCTPA